MSGVGQNRIKQQLAAHAGYRTVRFDSYDIRSNACDRFEVVIFSGSTGSGRASSLGDAGRQSVKRFV